MNLDALFNAPNEWGPLREVILGRVDGAVVPDEPRAMIQATMPESMWSFHELNAGRPFPAHLTAGARRELDAFAAMLRSYGIRVRRPEAPGRLFAKPIVTKQWRTKGGLYAAMPRDNLLAAGSWIIEAPMAWRSRRREHEPYQRLLAEYSRRGARRSTPPAPTLGEGSYTPGWTFSNDAFRPVITEDEPLFDAADFLKFGKHLIGQRSHVTNNRGIALLRRLLEPEIKVVILEFRDVHPMHIDATIMPLRPGLLLVNPERVPDEQIRILKNGLFKGWDLVKAPRPVIPISHPLFMTSRWISMNVLSLDPETVVVEARERPMIRLIRELGLRPIPVQFRNFNSFGGSFHCATLDVVRTGRVENVLG